MSTAKARIMRRSRRYLSIWKENIGLDNELGLTDINSDAEDFCCGLLNIVLDAQLVNMNLEKMNYPAVDLGDRKRRICVQVTSTAGAEKIDHTLDRFFAHELEKEYDRLIVMILGKKKQYKKKFAVKEGFSFDPDKDVWDIAKLLTQLAGLDMERLDRVDAYLREQFGALGELAAPMDLPVLSALDDFSFLGREAELEQIGKALETKKIVFLSGFGGMGKTELAVRFAQTRWGGESYFVSFTRDWKRTVLENIAPFIPDLNRDTADEERIFRDAMAELKARGAEELLILDNVDQEAKSLTQLKRELSGLNLRVLVTTRTDYERAINVARLHRAELHRLFEQHEAEATEEERDALIDAVDGHTLTVDLMARALRPGRRAATAEKLLKNLSDRTIKKVDTAYPGGSAQARINEHLRVVFRVSELTAKEQELLRYATLLPQNGMSDELLLAPFEDEEAVDDLLQTLIDKGWLLWKDELLKIHPVVRIVAVEELVPTDENCRHFLRGIDKQYDQKNYDAVKFRQMAELFETASKVLEDQNGIWAAAAGYLWLHLAEHQRALVCNLRAVEKLEREQPDTNNLATLYNNVGSTYDALGNHQKALEYLLKALGIREKVLPENHPDFAQSYNNVGGAYRALGNHEETLKYVLKALAICEKVLPENHPYLATSYNNVGSTYGDLGDHEKALEYLLKALGILEKVLPENHPDLAQSYNNVGSTYGDLGDHEKALVYKLKALGIREKVLPENHPDLAQSYNNVGSTYDDLGEHEKALEYLLKALEILERVLPKNHPYIASSCNNIAFTYGRLGDFRTAVGYIRRAVEIAEKRLPEGHPDLENYRYGRELIEKLAMLQEQGIELPNPFKQ